MVKPKKFLGQHFLRDQGIALQIADVLIKLDQGEKVMEIGPGTGVLSKPLYQHYGKRLSLCEIDFESQEYLEKNLGEINLYKRDYLQMVPDDWLDSNQEGIICGNFPYNISSQIVFSVIEHYTRYSSLGGMFQKEVAERICAKPGKKVYGILSVLTQAYFDTEYQFSVPPEVFYPPPKVWSGVVTMKRKKVIEFGCNQVLFKKVVKTAFNQRRKTLKNALNVLVKVTDSLMPFADQRAEQLSVDDFKELTSWIEKERPELIKTSLADYGEYETD